MYLIIFRRLFFTTLILFLAGSLSFFLIHLVPGDPVDLILGEHANQMDRLKLRESLGLNQSLWSQYLSFIQNVLKGDLGVSIHSQEPVSKELIQAFPASFYLAFFSLLLAALWGISAGVISVLKRGLVDTSLSFFSLLAMSIPAFCLAPVLIWLFSIKLSWLPVSEMGMGIEYFILPSLSLALPLGAILLKMTRAALLEVMGQDYIRTAKAKGLSRTDLYFKHALANAFIPIITILGLQMGALLTGTVIIESIFDWPGIGLLLLDSIQRRDYPVVQACVLFIAVIYVLVNLFVDLIYIWANPRMKSL